MSTTTPVPPDLTIYLAGVRAALADLAADERDDLLLDVESHLAEITHEGASLTARLGPPDAYAADLRAAAGMPAQPSRDRSMVRVVLRARSLLRNARARLAPLTRLADARVAWWILRGYGLAIAAGFAVSRAIEWSSAQPFIPLVLHNDALGLVAVVIGIACSALLGSRPREPGEPLRGRAVLAGAIALVALALPIANAWSGFDRPTSREAERQARERALGTERFIQRRQVAIARLLGGLAPPWRSPRAAAFDPAGRRILTSVATAACCGSIGEYRVRFTHRVGYALDDFGRQITVIQAIPQDNSGANR